MTLPRIYWTGDGFPLGVDSWSCSSVSNLGFYQFRGRVSAKVGLSLNTDQGSIIRGVTEYGQVMWEGRVSAPPKIFADGTALIAAQGHGFAAAKFAQRLPIIIRDPRAWQMAHKFPLNRVTDATEPDWVIGPDFGGIGIFLAANQGGIRSSDSSGTKAAVAIWSPGTVFSRITGFFKASGLGTIYSADGPNIATGVRPEYSLNATNADIDVTFKSPGDCVVLEVQLIGGGTLGPQANNLIIGDASTTATKFALYGVAQTSTLVYPETAAKAIGDRLGFDTREIGQPGAAQLSTWDWAGGAASGLSDLASTYDLCWRVIDDQGFGPVLEFGPYTKIWEVSGRQGTRWDMDALERYNRVVAQWVDRDGRLGQVEYQADPDPLADSGLVNEIQVSLVNQQTTSDSPNAAALAALKLGLTERWRGNITTARAFEAGTGREATYEVRAGDLVRITDFAADGSVTLRVHDVQYEPTGITIGVEAPALPSGVLQALGAEAPGQGANNGAVFNNDKTNIYAPPGSPRGPSPFVGSPFNPGGYRTGGGQGPGGIRPPS